MLELRFIMRPVPSRGQLHLGTTDMTIDFSWLTLLSPWFSGFFGGAGAILLWEGFLKPSRERRSLAHVLAEETAQNLNLAAMQLNLIRTGRSPEAVRPWAPLSSIVFQAAVPRLGELPYHVSKVIAVYRLLEIVNRYPPMIIAEWDDIRPELKGQQPTIEQSQRISRLRESLATFENWLDQFKRSSEKLLGELRKASVPWYRVDLRTRKRSEYILPEPEAAEPPAAAPNVESHKNDDDKS
jgi:hypothetical protein